jgi:hypothetical protein
MRRGHVLAAVAGIENVDTVIPDERREGQRA